MNKLQYFGDINEGKSLAQSTLGVSLKDFVEEYAPKIIEAIKKYPF